LKKLTLDILKKYWVLLKKSNIIPYFIVFISLFVGILIYAIITLPFHKGHDFYGAYSIYFNKPLLQILTTRFSADWYLGAYSYAYPQTIFISLMIKSLGNIFPSSNVTFKLALLLNFPISFTSMFLWLSSHELDFKVSLLGALIYTFCPYALVENLIEAHGGLGLGYALQPLAFLCLEKLIIRSNRINVILTSLSFSALILSSPQVFPILTFPFLMLYSLIRLVIRLLRGADSPYYFFKKCIFLAIAILLALGIACFWWFPLLEFRDFLYSTRYDIKSSLIFTTGWLQVLSLQSMSCCVPGIQIFFGSPLELALAMVIPLLIGFSLLISRSEIVPALTIPYLVAILFALGLNASIPLYEWAFKNLPFFDGIRTPTRFIFFISFASSTVIAIGMNELIRKIEKYIIKITFVLALFLLIISNSYTEAGYAFQTFKLPEPLGECYGVFKSIPHGRVFTVPLGAWVYTPKWRNVVNPMLWTFIFNQETVDGGAPSLATKDVGRVLDKFSWASYEAGVDIRTFCDVYSVDYIWVNKKDPRSHNFIYLDKEVVKIFENNDYVIYKNKNALPKLFLIMLNRSMLWVRDKVLTQQDDWKLLEGRVLKLEYEKISDVAYTINKEFVYRINARTTHSAEGYYCYIVLDYAYFPNWVLQVTYKNGTAKEISSEKMFLLVNGFNITELLQTQNSKEITKITIHLKPPVIELVSYLISGISIILCITLLFCRLIKTLVLL